jgi:hypothetical protein
MEIKKRNSSLEFLFERSSRSLAGTAGSRAALQKVVILNVPRQVPHRRTRLLMRMNVQRRKQLPNQRSQDGAGELYERSADDLEVELGRHRYSVMIKPAADICADARIVKRKLAGSWRGGF